MGPDNTDSEVEGSDDVSNDSDSDTSSPSDSDLQADSDEEIDAEEAAGGSGNQTRDDEEDVDDEIVQAFRRAKEIQRNHPPDIQCDDFIADISFHPSDSIIAAASIIGDVFL